MNIVILSHQLNRKYRSACGKACSDVDIENFDVDDFFNMYDGCAFE